MSDSDDVLKQFAEFMESKRAEESANGPEPEVEIWDKEGNGARVPRSAAKSFLQKFGIDLDETPPESDDGDGDSKAGKSKNPKPTGKSTPANSNIGARYFGKRPAGKLGNPQQCRFPIMLRLSIPC